MNKPNPRVATARKRPKSVNERYLTRLSGWLGRQSRLKRSLIAAVIALILDGAVAILLYSSLLHVSPGSYTFFALNQFNIFTVLFVVCVVLGLILYWIGWRVLIGFDFGESVLEPGRPAALWVSFGLIVLVSMIILLLLATLDALQ